MTKTLESLSRYQAAALHFFASASLLFIFFLFCRFIWFPGELFYAASGFDVMKILALVDVVLGPVIMLIIFNPKKASLKFDISCVLVCQIAFVVYGIWSIFTIRPVYIAFVENRFVLVAANEIENDDLQKSNITNFKKLPLFGPVIVGTKPPADEKTKEAILFSTMGGLGIQNLPQYYVPYTELKNTAIAQASTLEAITGIKNADKEQLMEFSKGYEHTQHKKLLFLRLITKKQPLFVAIDAETANVVQIL